MNNSEEHKNKLSISKLPVYATMLLLCIPLKKNRGERTPVVFCMLTGVVILIHGLGLVSLVSFIYGVITSAFVEDIPPLFLYALFAPLIFQAVHCYFFIMKSWNKQKAIKLLNLLDNCKSNWNWPTKYKIIVVLLMSYSSFAVVMAFYLWKHVYMYERNLHILFHYTSNQNFIIFVRISSTVFILYMNAMYALFPSYISYICLCLQALIERCAEDLMEIATPKSILAAIGLEKFILSFDEVTKSVSLTNEIYDINIWWFVVFGINNTVVWLYLSLVMTTCGATALVWAEIAMEGLAFSLLVLVASGVHTKVNILQD